MSTHRSHTRRNTPWGTPRRRTAAALTAALICGSTLLAITLTGDPSDNTVASDPPTGEFVIDLDGDGTPDDTITGTDPLTGDTITTTPEDLIADRDTVRDTLGVNTDPDAPTTPGKPGANTPPVDRVSQTLLTPPGPRWWDTVISVAADLHLDDLPAPDGATWFAVTTSRAKASSNVMGDPVTYNAIHVAFPTTEDTYDFLTSIGTTDLGAVMPYMRDSMLTFAPANIDLTAEGYHPDTPTPDLRPIVGTWTIDYGLTTTNTTSAAPNTTSAAAFTTFMSNVGYGPGVTWSGIAPTPTSPWTGTLTGFNPTAVNHRAAFQALTPTETVECDELTCYQTKPGLTDIPKAAAFAITNPASALAQSPALEQLPDPNGTIATYSIDWGLVRGMVANNYQSSGQAPFPLQRARLYPGGRQVITLDAYDNTKIASDG